LQEISPLQRLTLDDIERVGRQRLARSTCDKQAGTDDSRVVWFVGFIAYLGLGATYLVKDAERILFAYAVWLLSGNTLKVKNKPGEKFFISVDTIKGYLKMVNRHYEESGSPLVPYDSRDVSSKTVRLLKDQKSYESVAGRRARLPDKVLEKMRELSLDDDPHGFRRVAWLFTNVGRYAGLRIQEYGMDRHDVIKYYVLPDGTKVMRAFAVKDLLFYDEDGVLFSGLPANRESVEAVGLFFEIQKNRQNRQTQKFARERLFPEYCCAASVMEIVENAYFLGAQPDSPACLYRDGESTKFLTGNDMTDYFRFVTQLTFPNISDAELRLISSHSVRVTAVNLLHEAGKDGAYIKLRLRWLSDCYLIYLRNTDIIMVQHNAALEPAHRRMIAMAIREVNLPVVNAVGPVDVNIPDLEDED